MLFWLHNVQAIAKEVTLEFIEEGSALHTQLLTTNMSVDKSKMSQVLRNLLSNALKFTPEGGVVKMAAEVRRGSATGERDRLHVWVTDSGAGIAPVSTGLCDIMMLLSLCILYILFFFHLILNIPLLACDV